MHSIVRVKDAEEVAQYVALTSIRSFTGEYEFLSNLHKCRVVLPGEGVTEDDYVWYASAEHALQVRRKLLMCLSVVSRSYLAAS
jgi:hypothetical protein